MYVHVYGCIYTYVSMYIYIHMYAYLHVFVGTTMCSYRGLHLRTAIIPNQGEVPPEDAREVEDGGRLRHASGGVWRFGTNMYVSICLKKYVSAYVYV